MYLFEKFTVICQDFSIPQDLSRISHKEMLPFFKISRFHSAK